VRPARYRISPSIPDLLFPRKAAIPILSLDRDFARFIFLLGRWGSRFAPLLLACSCRDFWRGVPPIFSSSSASLHGAFVKPGCVILILIFGAFFFPPDVFIFIVAALTFRASASLHPLANVARAVLSTSTFPLFLVFFLLPSGLYPIFSNLFFFHSLNAILFYRAQSE